MYSQPSMMMDRIAYHTEDLIKK